MAVRSKTLANYQAWVASASYDDVNFVDKVYFLAEKQPNGDEITILHTPDDVLARFKSLNDVRRCLHLPLSP